MHIIRQEVEIKTVFIKNLQAWRKKTGSEEALKE